MSILTLLPEFSTTTKATRLTPSGNVILNVSNVLESTVITASAAVHVAPESNEYSTLILIPKASFPYTAAKNSTTLYSPSCWISILAVSAALLPACALIPNVPS